MADDKVDELEDKSMMVDRSSIFSVDDAEEFDGKNLCQW